MGETIVVIGANHAGTAAINTVLDQFPGNRVIAFDMNSNISFLGCGMALWIGKQISGPEGLFYSSKGIFEEKGAEIHMETRITRIDYDRKIVYGRDRDGKDLEQSYDKLILATGSLPIRPELQGMDLENVQFVKLFQNAQDVIEKLKDASIRKIAVVGAGYIGVELAEAFRRNGREVVLIDCAETCLSGYYDREFSDIMTKNLMDHGVKLAFGETVTELEGDGKVQKIITDKGSHEADMVVFGIGFKPNTMLGQGQIKVFKNQAFLTDRKQETSIPGVYAIGDRIMVFLFEKTDDTPEDPEEKGQVITLDEQVYTRDGIEYAKYITKTIYPGSSRPDYGISIEFEAYGREYAALVWSTRFDEVVKKDMDQILDSLEVDLDVQGKK